MAEQQERRASLSAACRLPPATWTPDSTLAWCAQVWIQKESEALSDEMRNEALMYSPCLTSFPLLV